MMTIKLRKDAPTRRTIRDHCPVPGDWFHADGLLVLVLPDSRLIAFNVSTGKPVEGIHCMGDCTATYDRVDVALEVRSPNG